MHRITVSKKAVRIGILLSVLLIVASIPASALWVRTDSDHQVFKSPTQTPFNRVGLVLGCNRNVYFYTRVEAASNLFKAGRIEYILVSGDNHAVSYDETSAMKNALMARGIPENRIVCDFAGFSTIDSIVRAQKVFGQTSLTIISQEFHIRRALFIANRKGIDAVGFCAADVETSIAARTLLREQFARVKTVLDLYVLNRKPRFLGVPIQIGTDESAVGIL